MMKLKIYISLLLSLFAIVVKAQTTIKVSGELVSATTRKPIINATITSRDAVKMTMTDELGKFTIELYSEYSIIEIRKEGYQNLTYPLLNKKNIKIFLLPDNMRMYSREYLGSDGIKQLDNNSGAVQTIDSRDIALSYNAIDDALIGKLRGVQMQNKGGMPGEGSLINMHGIRSLVSDNSPLIVIDGMPFLPDKEESYVINGFSKSLLAAINRKNVKRVTLLRGTEAAPYGSMGSNGVLMIETERATDLETRIEFQTTEGVTIMSKRIPLMQDVAFKNYIGDIGETKYNNPLELVSVFPFLKDDPDDNYKYLYNNNTNWQDEIYTNGFSSENMLKVKGGDAVAKYALSLGYVNNKGILENTSQSKYYTRLNSDIFITKRFKAFVTAGLNYSEYKLQEQGIVPETNPILASMHKSPLLSVYEQDRFQNNMPNFNPVRGFGISNPLAILSDLEAKSKSYDVLLNIGISLDITRCWTIGVNGGLYYNYNKEDIFIPGKSSQALAPLMDGLAQNTVRSGIGETVNYYLKAYGNYNRTFSKGSQLSATIGYQLMSTRKELDCGSGINTNSDFYRTLGSTITTHSRKIIGYLDQWNWMNGYFSGQYTLRNQLTIGGALVADISSSYGENSERIYVFPSVKASWNLKNSLFSRCDMISAFSVSGEYSINGNSRFSSKYSRYFYATVPLRDQAGLIRMSLPNTSLGPEKNYLTNFGLDFAIVGNRIHISTDLFREHTKEMLLDSRIPAAYGFKTKYNNKGEIQTEGVDLSLVVNLVNGDDLQWSIGGNIATHSTKVKSLGAATERLVTFSDGTELISQVGDAPNQFYGYKTNGVIASKAEALALDIKNPGGSPFMAGDIRFVDADNNSIIDSYDKTVIGNAMPDFYGGFFTHIKYKKISLTAQFSYSCGNEIYNAVRRQNESMTTFANQTRAVERRWIKDGQTTDIPKAIYGDPISNSRFSERWIEDGSYLKLKEVTLSYSANKKLWFFHNLTAYITGENLMTFTKYHGLDPEFAFSYDMNLLGMDLGKLPIGKGAKIGLVLNF